MIKKNKESKDARKIRKITDHARVLDHDERMSRYYKNRDNREKKKAENKDRFAKIIYLEDPVESSNKNKTCRSLIVFNDEFKILRIKIFSKNNFTLDQKINTRKNNSEFDINSVHSLKVKDLPPNAFRSLQKILVRKFKFKKTPTKKDAQHFLESHRPRKGSVGTMPTGIYHSVYHDHGFQFPNG